MYNEKSLTIVKYLLITKMFAVISPLFTTYLTTAVGCIIVIPRRVSYFTTEALVLIW